ncbi:MAG: hypothetical protein C0397_19355 [Odoribacter sp.]|nr:hypothetical protein [Odoribacter sp.]
MKYKLVKLNKFSGHQASIYSIFIEDEQKTLFDRFLEENKNLFLSELKDITARLNTIGHYTGAREKFFRFKEGIPGDGVCALFDVPDSNLRLYCIRYGSLIVILGGGGYKPKGMASFQENTKLQDENYLLRQISSDIKRRMADDEISFTDDYMDFEGNLIFNDEEDE